MISNNIILIVLIIHSSYVYILRDYSSCHLHCFIVIILLCCSYYSLLLLSLWFWIIQSSYKSYNCMNVFYSLIIMTVIISLSLICLISLTLPIVPIIIWTLIIHFDHFIMDRRIPIILSFFLESKSKHLTTLSSGFSLSCFCYSYYIVNLICLFALTTPLTLIAQLIPMIVVIIS